MTGDNQTLQDALNACECEPESEETCPQSQVLTPQSRRQLRALAFHYLYAADRFDYQEDIEQIAQEMNDHYRVKLEEDADFPLDMARGVVEHRERYAQLIQPLLENWKFDRIGCCTRIILYMAFWEFEQPDAVASIVINEAIELAKSFAEKDAYRFVNGILDQAKANYPHAIENDKASRVANEEEDSPREEDDAPKSPAPEEPIK